MTAEDPESGDERGAGRMPPRSRLHAGVAVLAVLGGGALLGGVTVISELRSSARALQESVGTLRREVDDAKNKQSALEREVLEIAEESAKNHFLIWREIGPSRVVSLGTAAFQPIGQPFEVLISRVTPHRDGAIVEGSLLNTASVNYEMLAMRFTVTAAADDEVHGSAIVKRLRAGRAAAFSAYVPKVEKDTRRLEVMVESSSIIFLKEPRE